MVEHYINGRRVYTVDEAATLLKSKTKTLRARLSRAGIQPAGWINPRLAVYYPENFGLVQEKREPA